MRTAFARTLAELAETDHRIFLLTGDLGYSVFEPFAQRFPNRFVNVGVAEQNMIGVAAGLALSGKIVFTYSIAGFGSLRCLEQIRNDVCHHGADVKIVTVGAGFHYGSQGYTHFGVEDLSVLRALPGLPIYNPADPVEAALAVRALIENPGPGYLRIGGNSGLIHREEKPKSLEKPLVIREGCDLTIAASGPIADEALKASEMLAGHGIEPLVLSVPRPWPPDTETLLECAKETGAVLTVEEHGVGGLGSILAEILCARPTGAVFRALTARPDCHRMAAPAASLRAAQGLDAPGIAQAALELAETKNRSGRNRAAQSTAFPTRPEARVRAWR